MRMSSKATTAEPQLLPSPPPSPTPSDASTERGVEVLDNGNEAYLAPASPTANKGKGRMVDGSIETSQSDQDDDSDEYHPDEMETRRIEEVSEGICSLLFHRSLALFPWVHAMNVLPVESSQMGNGGTRTKKDGSRIRFSL